MNKKIDELKDQYYENKDISDSELAEIEAELQEMEDRLEDLEVRIRDILNSLITKSSASSVHSCENEISQADSKQKLEIKLPEILLPVFRDSLKQQLWAFWEIETVDESSKEYSLEEEICETQYQNTHYRNEEGRYVVQLPFKKDPTV
ncbi:hypothetical protein TNCT_32931 [Trichonephila clavata]|uniref:Uncharacterized protein n=1 Tax=Trichonephila clavata TaxID=2740835 RepID=A0A8X6K8Q0_TRICU|nr:hypothetical protein TNCT_32931 [Trichonephila clavata]